MITIHAKQIMIEQYSEVIHVTSNQIWIKMKNQDVEIKGANLQVVALSKYEILVEGTLEGLLFHETK